MCFRECSVWKGCCVEINMRWYSLFRLYPIWHIYLSFLFCSGFMMVMMLIATSVVTNRQLCDQSPGIWSSTRPNTHQTLRSLHLVGTVHCRRPMQWYACFEHILFYTQTLYTRECTLVTTKSKTLHFVIWNFQAGFLCGLFSFLTKLLNVKPLSKNLFEPRTASKEQWSWQWKC